MTSPRLQFLCRTTDAPTNVPGKVPADRHDLDVRESRESPLHRGGTAPALDRRHGHLAVLTTTLGVARRGIAAPAIARAMMTPRDARGRRLVLRRVDLATVAQVARRPSARAAVRTVVTQPSEPQGVGRLVAAADLGDTTTTAVEAALRGATLGRLRWKVRLGHDGLTARPATGRPAPAFGHDARTPDRAMTGLPGNTVIDPAGAIELLRGASNGPRPLRRLVRQRSRQPVASVSHVNRRHLRRGNASSGSTMVRCGLQPARPATGHGS